MPIAVCAILSFAGMEIGNIVSFFLPEYIRNNKTDERYHELSIIIGLMLSGAILLSLTTIFLSFSHRQVLGFVVHIVLCLVILASIRLFAHYRIPMLAMGFISYLILYDFIATSGYIYSPNIYLLHVSLVAAVLADKRFGWLAIYINCGLLVYVYTSSGIIINNTAITDILGKPIYTLSAHIFITVFLGGFLAYSSYNQEKTRKTIKALQDQRIGVLDETVKRRTEQLTTMRQTIASDFHDETGNSLAAITRQALLLEMRLQRQPEHLATVKSIAKHSNDLYAASRDFLWNLNHDSDDPMELFNYLTAYGQQYYNQFDVSFSTSSNIDTVVLKRLDPFAPLNIIYIMKEAMGNVIKHAQANEVTIAMQQVDDSVTYTLHDNGKWKRPDGTVAHYGIGNMEKRCAKNRLIFQLTTGETGTRIQVTAPLNF